MAFVLPIFVLVIMGVVEFGRAFMVQHLLANAARVGVRQAIVDGSTVSDVEDSVRQLCSQTIGVDANCFDVDVSGGSSGWLSEAETGEPCSVTITVPFSNVSFVPGTYLGEATLNATCSMEHE